MCGLTGFVTLAEDRNKNELHERIHAMSDTLIHRDLTIAAAG